MKKKCISTRIVILSSSAGQNNRIRPKPSGPNGPRVIGSVYTVKSVQSAHLKWFALVSRGRLRVGWKEPAKSAADRPIQLIFSCISPAQNISPISTTAQTYILLTMERNPNFLFCFSAPLLFESEGEKTNLHPFSNHHASQNPLPFTYIVNPSSISKNSFVTKSQSPANRVSSKNSGRHIFHGFC